MSNVSCVPLYLTLITLHSSLSMISYPLPFILKKYLKVSEFLWVFPNQLFRKSSPPSKKCFDPINKPNYSSVWSRLRPSLGRTKVWLFGPDPGQEGFTPVISDQTEIPKSPNPTRQVWAGPKSHLETNYTSHFVSWLLPVSWNELTVATHWRTTCLSVVG